MRGAAHLPALLVLTLFALLPGRLWAAVGDFFTVTYDGQTLRYKITSEEDKTVAVCSGEVSGDLIIPEKASYNDVEYSVTELGEYAFDSCSNLTSVTIPNSVTSIGTEAFYSCDNLTSVIIGNSVTDIGQKAFYSCYDLRSVIFGISVKNIGENAFESCMKLIKVAYPSTIDVPVAESRGVEYPADDVYFEDGWVFSADKSVIYFAPISLEGEYTLPANIREIGQLAFHGCNLTSITPLPTTVPTFHADAFYHLYSTCLLNLPSESFADYLTQSNWYLFEKINGAGPLEDENFKYRINPSTDNRTAIVVGPTEAMKGMNKAYVPAKVTLDGKTYSVIGIQSHAFESCKMAKVTLCDGIEYIGDYAFEANHLENLELPNSIKRIGEHAFAYNSFASVTLGNGVEIIGDYAFSNTGLTTITIPDCVKTIGDHAFYEIKALKSVTIGNGLQAVSDSAFASCSLLESVTLGNGIQKIGNYAFSSTKIKELIIPGNVKEIGEDAFNMSSLKQGLTLNEGIEKIGKEAFYLTKFSEIVIPASVDSIGEKAFAACEELAKFGLADSSRPIFIGSSAIAPSSYKKRVINEIYIGRNYNLGNPDEFRDRVAGITFGYLLTEISASDFANSTSLKSITLGTGITEIPEGAFKNCSIEEIVIPSNVTTIGENAFYFNELTNVIMVCRTAEIGANAFANNNSIATIYVTAVNPPAATNDVFSTQSAKLNVLKESVAAYKNADCWNQFEVTDLVPISVFKILNEPVPDNAPSRTEAEARKQLQLTVSVEPANASLKEYIFWSSSNPEVATVDNNGLVTFTDATEGTAEITAHTLYADVVASVIVKAKGEVNGVGEIYIDDSFGDNSGLNSPKDIYNLQGICLKRNASQADVDALAPGLYIIGNKKVLVK